MIRRVPVVLAVFWVVWLVAYGLVKSVVSAFVHVMGGDRDEILVVGVCLSALALMWIFLLAFGYQAFTTLAVVIAVIPLVGSFVFRKRTTGYYWLKK